MKKYAAIILVSAIITHLAVVALIPNAIMFLYFERMKSENIELNKIYHVPPINASFRRVVMPSPDLLYSFCIYDVSEKPVLIDAEIPKGTYWSVSLYDSSTNNFFTLNDQKAGERARILLVKDMSQLDREEKVEVLNATVVKAKSDKGLVLFRTFIPDKSYLPYFDEVRKNWICKTI